MDNNSKYYIVISGNNIYPLIVLTRRGSFKKQLSVCASCASRASCASCVSCMEGISTFSTLNRRPKKPQTLADNSYRLILAKLESHLT